MEKKKEYTGWPGDCSEQQLETLTKFKEIVTDMKLSLQVYNDSYLLRFLRARKFNLEQTKKMWTAFIEWRVKNGVDTIFQIKLPQIPQVRKYYPHGYHKTDKKFRPVYIERVGKLDIDKLFKQTNPQRLLTYYTLLYEFLLKQIFPACNQYKLKSGNNDGIPVDQTVFIMDMKSVSMGNLNKTYNLVKPATNMAQDNYPEMLGTMFIINAPMLFTGIWMMIKPWIDQKTVKKVKILGSSFKKELFEVVDPENIPDFIDGGKCKCSNGDCLNWNIGPWNPDGKELFAANF